MGEHKKESVDMTTLTERYNRKRTPVVQRPELSTTPLVEPEVAGSQNPVAPTVDNTDETAPQASVVEPQMNDYQWNQRLYETLFQKPISQEEEERRKRAASVATGIGHLGNVLSSFSNLAFAGEAPSQKLPTVADPKLQSYSDRLEAIRQRYGAGYLAARQNDINNYQRALSLYRQDQARKEDLAARKAAIERQKAVDQWNKDKWEKEHEADQAYKKGRLGLDAEKIALERREIENREKSGYYSGRSSRRTSVSSNNNGVIVLDTPDGFMDIDMSKVNLSTLSQMFNSLPDSVKKNYRISSRDSEKDRQAKYMSAIGEAAKADPSIADYLYRSGTGKLREGTKSDVINYLPQRLSGKEEDIVDYNPIGSNTRQAESLARQITINQISDMLRNSMTPEQIRDALNASEADRRKKKNESFDRLIAKGGINRPFYNVRESINKM